jgi:hypothetical protein
MLGSSCAYCLRWLLMNLLIIADDESVRPQIPDCTVDVLVSCGDLPDELILKAAASCREMARCRCREMLAVRGNHDSSVIRTAHCEPLKPRKVCSTPFQGGRNRADN